jgi:apolipoprotein N-acyltransferase
MNRQALREALPPAVALLALFFLPWGPLGPAGVRFAWDLAKTHYAEAIPAFLGPVTGLVLLLAVFLRVADRTRDLLWATFGLVLLAAGLSEASEVFATRGLGPSLLVACALGAAGHRLRLAGELPRASRAALALVVVLIAAHFLWPVAAPGGEEPRVAQLVRFAGDALRAAQYGYLAFEVLVLFFAAAALATAVVAGAKIPAGAADRFLGAVYAWAVPGMLLLASVPLFLHLPPSQATGYLAVAVAAAAGLRIASLGMERAARRAAQGEFQSREERPFFARFCLTSVCAALVFFAFPRFDQPHLVWFAFLPLLFVVTDVTPRRAFLWGWWTGLVTNLGGFYWITGLLVAFAKLPRPAAFALCLLLAGYNGLVFAIWAYLTRKLEGRTRLPLALLSAVVFTSVELLIWELFPWYLGNSQYRFLPAIQVADFAGVPGVTFLVAFVGAAVHVGARALVRGLPFPRWTVVGAGATFALAIAYGLVRMWMVASDAAQAPQLKIGVAQANIAIEEPPADHLRKLRQQDEMSRDLAARGADLVVLPESAKPVLIPKAMRKLPDSVQNTGVPLLFGAESEAEVGGRKRKYNTAFFVDRDGTVLGTYDKVYLLLFGEYVPYLDRPWMEWLRKMLPYDTPLTPGTEVEVFPFRGHRLGVMICYEDILPAFTRRLAGKNPNVLLNLTNDAWFGKSSEPYHHMALSVFRAVENRLYLVRSVRTGVSGFVDATGRIYAQIDLDRRGTLLESVAMMGGTTVYREVGDVFAYAVLLMLAFALFEALRAWLRARPRPAARRKNRKGRRR